MKIILIHALILTLVLGCKQNNTEKSNVKTDSVKEVIKDENIVVETNSLQSKTKEEKVSIINHNNNTNLLDRFLLNPLDLQAFKRTKGGSNSTGYSYEENLFRPKYTGFYINYFLFKGFGESGPSVVAYRDKKKSNGKFIDDADTLIQLFSDRSDPDLRSASLVGKSISYIKSLYGTNYLKEEGYLYYTNAKGMILTIYHGGRERVRWFKWTRLNKNVNKLDEIPSEIKDKRAG